MKHFTIGTAGHIDHGKTALIKALTGRDTDRLKEEKERGITTELGFTWFDTSDGDRCGIVDVPGHEKFIRHMAAGAAGMDLVLMVVAADEGMMPQTREHLDILELLGVKKTILVINKCDLVDEGWLELVKEDLKEELKGTIMENAPQVCVSALTGQGIDELKSLISRMVREEMEPRDVNSIPRLPIDRVFTLPGFGTIVTGTLLSGMIGKGDILQLYPEGRSCRVRNIQVHGENQDFCQAGQRSALNLADLSTDQIRRGDVISLPGCMKNTSLIDVRLVLLGDSQRTVINRERLHFFTGTAHILCRAILLDAKKLEPGQSCFAQLLLEEETVVRRGDRFVVRFYSPLETIGGGIVLEPLPAGRKKRFDPDAVKELVRKEKGSLADVVEMRAEEAGLRLISVSEIARAAGRTCEETALAAEKLAQEGSIFLYEAKNDSFVWHRGSMAALAAALRRDLAKYHQEHPYRRGMPRAQLRTTYMKSVKLNLFDLCMDTLAREGVIWQPGSDIALAGFCIPQDELREAITGRISSALEEAGFNFLRVSEIDLKAFPADAVQDIFQLMAEENILVRISEDVYTMSRFVEEAKKFVEDHFQKEEILTIVQLRDHFGTSRKCAKLLSAYVDQIRLTRKAGAETERVRA